MDTSEVIIEKVIENRSLDEELQNTTSSNIEKSNDVPSTVKKLPNNDNKASLMYSTNEVIILDTIEMEQVSDKNGKSKPKSSTESPDIVQNEISVNNGNINQNTIEDFKEKDDDICIVHEESATSIQKNDKVSSLSSIAVEYGNSDSEAEDVSEKVARENNAGVTLIEIQMQPYRQAKEASSSEESDSEDDSTSSSDSSVIVASSESDSDDSLNKRNKENDTKWQKSSELKSELDDLPPIEDLKISVPEVLCDPLGEVAWMVEQLVVVKPKPGKPTLNLDTVLFVDKGKRALGKIFDVFGQVNEPHYCVRFNSSEHIKECEVKVGMTVYYCPNTEYTSLVFLHELMKLKGIDANADEPPEFSDDEEERVYYKQLKAKQANNATNADVPFKRKRTKPNTGWQSNHPWNRNTQRQRKGFYPRTDRQQQFPSAQTEGQSQALWSQLPYENTGEQYEYGPYSLQPVEYMNQNFDSYGSHNCYNEDGTAPSLLNPRIPFGAPPRIPTAYLPFQSHSNSPATSVRFQNAMMPWLSSIPQIPVRMRMSWVPLPPPPPPPPTSSASTDPS